MEVARYLEWLRNSPDYDGQLEHLETLPERAGQFVEPERPLPGPLNALLATRGVERLYTHQAEALDAVRRGCDVVVVTGTASGKTLCYNLPILESCLTNPATRALYLFPTKALAQDQLKGLLELLSGDPEIAAQIRPGVFDGDTPTSQRRRIRAESNLVLSNPDMLHASILPYHPKWARFFSELRYIVLDEVHTYRGVLGANVACVLRRLLRVCAHYGSHPLFLAASATIANPGELTTRLIGREVRVINTDGSPRGRKYFALWNPSPLGKDRLARRSANDDAVWLMHSSMEAGAQVLAFTRTRQAAELINRYVQESLRGKSSPLARQMRAYRGGYLPKERRQIEQDLFAGKLRGISATNALELGIDIGSLDVVLLVHYPGTFASVWQQAGRAGRRTDDSLAILLAGNDPIDQFLLRHPDYFFAQSPEHAVVDPENTYVLAKHLRAAAFELPLDDDAVALFGPLAPEIAEILCEAEQLTQLAGKYYFASGQNPAHQISLRHMSDNTFSIVLRRPPEPNQVIANVDAISAPELVYPEAVYLHHGETFFVRELDLNGKVAYVERREMDYYTQAVLESNVRITNERENAAAGPHDAQDLGKAAPAALGCADLAFGDVDVTWKTVAFKKIKFNTRENVGFGPVDIPEQLLPTTAFWLTPRKEIRQRLKSEGLRTSEGICGLRNLAIVALPIVAMCDSRDISGVVDSKYLGTSTLILYDRYPGGLGYCEKGYHAIDELLRICHEMIATCVCEDGCPSCVGLPNLRPAIHSDPDLTRGYPIPDKAATLRLLELLTSSRQVTAAGFSTTSTKRKRVS
jgi:DEAD/DEAH box helicase domain-containing protein